jgi:Concanavalin A-like lectin/glucanases superfamily
VANQPLSGSIEASNGALSLGGNPVRNEFFGGLIDEVRVYDRALTANEIQTNMNTPVVNDNPDQDQPWWWRNRR